MIIMLFKVISTSIQQINTRELPNYHRQLITKEVETKFEIHILLAYVRFYCNRQSVPGVKERLDKWLVPVGYY